MDPTTLPDLAKTFGPVGALAIYLWWQTRSAPGTSTTLDQTGPWREAVSKALEDIAHSQREISEILAILKDRSERK